MGLRKKFKKIGAKNLIVLDIGTEFLKALFLEVNEEEERGILRTWVKEKVGDDLEKLYPVCQKAVNKLEKKVGIKGKQLFLGIGGEAVKGTSTVFSYKREDPGQKINLPELRYLVQKVQWKAFNNIRKAFALETGLPETNVRLINAHIINIKIDGSHIANPLGFQGKNVYLSIFNSYGSVNCLEDLLSLSSQLGLELVGISPPSYALFHCLDLENLSKEDALIIDVGGKITEVTLIKNKGEFIETRSFNLGGQVFTRAIADFLDLGMDEAEAVKIKYSKREVSSEVARKLEKLVNPNISSWSGGIKVVLDEFLRRYKSLPKKIFLCGGGSSLPGIKEALMKRRNFQIKFILPREFVKIENKTKFQDIPCLALSELALESPKATEFSSTLKRVVRLIQG